MVIAQNPTSTEYDGMPRSAINTGLLDYVLPPAEMPAQLIAYVAHTFGKISCPISPSDANVEDSLKKIFWLLRAQIGHDFSQYKLNTITRCVERRMAVHQIGQLEEYARYLEQTPADVEALFRDLLIGVTSFFRDVNAFEALQQQVIPRLFARQAGGLVDSRLGTRLFHRRGGLFHCHPAPGAIGGAEAEFQAAGVRHRH
jgi:two-component system CheB/CheR fusion protein